MPFGPTRTVTITVDAPVDFVWQYVTNLANRSEWRHVLSRIPTFDRGSARPGMALGGGAYLTAWRPNKEFAVGSKDGSHRDRFRLRRLDRTSTSLTLSCSFNLMAWFVFWSLKTDVRGFAIRAKKAIEQQWTHERR